MRSEWFSASELSKISIDKSYKTPQQINKKAKFENWLKRDKQGVQGKEAYEYHYEALPLSLRASILIQECIGLLQAAGGNNAFVLWLIMCQLMTPQQCDKLVSLVMTLGIDSVIHRLENK